MNYLAVAFLVVGLTAGPAHGQTLENPDALGLLAAAQRHLDDREYRRARQLAADVIEEIERQTNRYHPALVDALAVHGQALHGLGYYDDAIRAYHRAQHISRIAAGLHTPDQVDIVYKEAESWVAVGDVKRADELYQYALETLRRAHGESLALVPGLFRMAEWNMRTYSVFEAREHYEHAAEILKRNHAPEDPQLVPALRGIARSYQLERLPPAETLEPSEPTFTITTGHAMARSAGVDERRPVVNRFGPGEAALKQIIEIHQADPATPTHELVEAYLDLADWNLIFKRWGDARTLYRFARQLWLDRGGDPREVDAYFDRPVPLYLPLPTATRDSRHVPARLTSTGYVDLQYSVDARGRTYDVRAVDSNPSQVLDVRTVREMRDRGIFRPRITALGPEDSRAHVHRHTFAYMPDGAETQTGVEVTETR
jgi:tetratricopeptide (TPR) repeat protein